MTFNRPRARRLERRRQEENILDSGTMRSPGHTAVGTWSGGRFMHFGEPLDEARLEALLRPGGGISTVHHRRRLRRRRGRRAARPRAGRAAARRTTAWSARSGTTSTPASARGRRASRASPTRALRGPDGYADYVRMAAERSLERCGADAFDLLLLHNPDRTGYTERGASGTRWRPLRDDGLTGALGVAPGPGERLHARPDRLPRALRRPDRLGDGDPQPARAVAGRAGRSTPPRRHGVRLITRVVDYGGLFHDDVLPGHPFPRATTARSGPAGWVERGRERLDADAPDRRAPRADDAPARVRLEPRPRAGRLRRADADPGARRDARPIEDKRAELAAVPAVPRAERRRGRGDPRDRRQHGLDGAQGRRARLRGRSAARPLAAQRRPGRARRAAGGSTPRATSIRVPRRRQTAARGGRSRDEMRLVLLAVACLLVARRRPPRRTTRRRAHAHGHPRRAQRRSTSPPPRPPPPRPARCPYAWCGDERTTDDVAHAALPADLPALQDRLRPPRRPARPLRRLDATRCRPTSRSSSASSPPRAAARKALRFDMGTRCGPQYVDVQVVAPEPVRARLRRQLQRDRRRGRDPARAAPTRRATWSCSPTRSTAARYDYGLGENVLGSYGERPRRRQRAQPRRLRLGAVHPATARPRPAPARAAGGPRGCCTRSRTTSAACSGRPRTRRSRSVCSDPRYGHCWQGDDVMCYLEDSGAAHAMRNDCPRIGGAIPQVYDCGRDDYFNPAPAAGSYLATHWNVYDNAFLAPCAQDRPRLRRRHGRPRPRAAGRHRRPAGHRHAAPRRHGDRQRRQLAQRPDRLRLPLAARARAAAGRTSPAPRVPPTAPRAPTAAAGCACRSSPPTPTAAPRPRRRRARAWPTGWSATRRR